MPQIMIFQYHEYYLNDPPTLHGNYLILIMLILKFYFDMFEVYSPRRYLGNESSLLFFAILFNLQVQFFMSVIRHFTSGLPQLLLYILFSHFQVVISILQTRSLQVFLFLFHYTTLIYGLNSA